MAGHIHLKREFAREADAHDARLDAGHSAFAVAHEGEGGGGQVHVLADFFHHGAALWADHRKGAPLVGDGGHIDLHLGPLGLHPAFHPAQHAGRTAGGGGHQETVFSQTHGDTVVKHHAVFVQHQAVAGLAHFQLQPGVGVQPVQELGSVRALDVDLAQGGCIHDADAGAHGQHFAVHRSVHVFAGLGEVPGALPLAHVFKRGAGGHMVGVGTGLALGVEQLAALQAGEQAKADGHVVGAEGGGAHLRNGLAHGACGQGHAVDIAQLALVGTKAHGGVALDVLDGLKAFADGQLDVGGAHVVLPVHKGLGAARNLFTGLGNPEGNDGFVGGFHHAVAGLRSHKSGLRGSGRAGTAGLQHGVGQGAGGVAGAHAELAGHGCTRLEAFQRVAPQGPSAAVRIQVNGRVPATGHAHRVHTEGAALAVGLVAHLLHHRDGGDHGAAVGLHRHIAAQHFDAGVVRLLRQAADHRMTGPHIDHSDCGTGCLQGHCIAISHVVVGQQHNLLAHQHAIQLRIVGQGAGEHDVGQVVVAKHHGALMRTGGQHHLLGAHAPQALAETLSLGQWQMVCQRLADG